MIGRITHYNPVRKYGFITVTVRWYNKGAEQGNTFAQYNLGNAYVSGSGISPDSTEGYKWLFLAQSQGYSEAAAPLADLKAKMTADQIAEAERRAKLWQAQHPNPAE